MKKGKTFFSLLILAIALQACDFFIKNDNEKALARVGDNYLYKKDIKGLANSEELDDSSKVLDSYIESWVKEQLLLQKALENLPENQANFEEQLKNYKNSLLIYTYENLLVKQKLDTSVSKREVMEYYKNNQQNFKLKEPLFLLKFVKIINSAPTQDSLNYWFYSEMNYSDKVMNYCTQFATLCHLDTTTWLTGSKLKGVLLNGKLKTEDILQSDEQKMVVSDSLNTIFFKVLERRKVSDLAPLNFVKDQINDIIINKRKLRLLSKAKQEIFEAATIEKQYEVFH